MNYIVFGNFGQATAYQLVCSHLFGYPQRGRSIHGDDKGPSTPGYGWTLRQYDLLEHPISGDYAHPEVDPDTEGTLAHITTGEEQIIRGYLGYGEELTSDWWPEEP